MVFSGTFIYMFQGQSRAQDRPLNLRGTTEGVCMAEKVHKGNVFTVADLPTISTSRDRSGP
jgi:hypothetical protein